jgi:O-acetyl-ADP-ribose deacetylase (regulator of RNase III)
MATDTCYSCPDRRGSAVCQVDYTTEDWVHCIHCGKSLIGRNDTMLIHVMNDIFDGQPNKCIMVQQVNTQGVMGSGLAKAIRNKYPQVFEHYRGEYELGLLELGYTSYIEVEPDKFVANICGQEFYGRDGKQYTSYNALRTGLEDVKMMAEVLNVDVVIPFRIGCGLGGGDWNGVVLPMVEEIFKDGLVAFVFQGGDEDYAEKTNSKDSKDSGQKFRSNSTGLIDSNGQDAF